MERWRGARGVTGGWRVRGGDRWRGSILGELSGVPKGIYSFAGCGRRERGPRNPEIMLFLLTHGGQDGLDRLFSGLGSRLPLNRKNSHLLIMPSQTRREFAKLALAALPGAAFLSSGNRLSAADAPG